MFLYYLVLFVWLLAELVTCVVWHDSSELCVVDKIGANFLNRSPGLTGGLRTLKFLTDVGTVEGHQKSVNTQYYKQQQFTGIVCSSLDRSVIN